MDPNASAPSLSNTARLHLGVLAQRFALLGNASAGPEGNATGAALEESLDVHTDVYSKVLVTVVYAALFVVGCVGNAVTLCALLWRKGGAQSAQSTVRYHLASLALSDLLILVLSMPVELYNFIWVHHPWAFGAALCKGYYFVRDGCSFATALNVASLSTERYLAICHPFKAKSIVSRSRARRLIGSLWAASFLLATPMLLTMGQRLVNGEKICTTVVSAETVKSVLQVNALLSFVAPMLVIAVLNGAIARKLQQMFRQDCSAFIVGGAAPVPNVATETQRLQWLRHSVKVLRAVVLAFVVCWLPYHSRRLMYCYVTEWTESLFDFYHYFYMVTNVLFYVSSAINPILYNLVSANFRQIFFSTLRHLYLHCRWEGFRVWGCGQQQAPPRHSNSVSSNHTFSIKVYYSKARFSSRLLPT